MSERITLVNSRFMTRAKLSFGIAAAALAVACGSGQSSEVRSTPTPANINTSVDIYANTGSNDPCNIAGGAWTQEQKDFFLQECKDFFETEQGQRVLKEVVPNIPVVTPSPTR